jgi:UDP-glucose 4-epimerase
MVESGMSILITGGAGYIGSHMVLTALDRGDDVVVLDNLSTGVRSLVAEQAHFHLGSVDDQVLLSRLIQYYSITAVIHFAGSTVVPESVDKPLEYYRNNTMASRNLIEACVNCGVKNFIFSSTAAVYGTPDRNPVTEHDGTAPISPYGRSKLMTEWMLEDTARVHDFRYVALRYFNVAGADPAGRTGQSTRKATHLIKRACQVALGRVPMLEIFGTDFRTADGTGVRDYIHVSDLAAAHALALDHLEQGGASTVLNCGYGHGFSVREVVETVSRVVGRAIPTRDAPARPGDLAALVADSSKLQTQFGWRPEYDDLQEIVSTAYAWERRLNAT